MRSIKIGVVKVDIVNYDLQFDDFGKNIMWKCMVKFPKKCLKNFSGKKLIWW